MGDAGSIIHVNVTDFFASIAMAQDSSLKRKAFVIAPESYGSCAIINTSAGARQEGIERGMSVSQARRILPHLTVLPPDQKAGRVIQQELYELACDYTPSIEHDAKGHLYLDTHGTSRLFGPPLDVAVKLSSRIRERLSLAPAIGVADNRLVAKIATRAIRPSGVTAIAKGEERLFLRSQDISLLPGLTRSTRKVLVAAGIREIGTVADLDETQALLLFGKDGPALRRFARGEDLPGTGTELEGQRHVEARVDFARPSEHLPTIEGGLFQILEEIWTALREKEEEGARLELTVFWADRQLTVFRTAIPSALFYDEQLIGEGRRWLSKALSRRIMVSSISARVSQLHPRREQRDLFLYEKEERTSALQQSIDQLRHRYGNQIVTRSFALYHG